MAKRGKVRLPGWAIALAAIAVYFAVLLPYGVTPLISHPDERHYAYAGIRMVETGDWLVPQTPDGEIRLKKPILPYWFAAAGFELLGIGVAGFRFFWILAACATLGLTYALARVLGASERTSLLALLLTAANPLFFRAALQSIPDMPLTLFMMMAAVGFSRILVKAERPPLYAAWLGWMGIALGILTKGILPLIFAVFVLVFTGVFARPRLKALLASLPMLAALVLVVAWYLYVMRTHPDEFFAQFFSDQLTGKVTFNPLRFVPQLPGYLLAGIISLFGLPLVLATAWWRSRRRAAIASWPFVIKLLAVWTLTVPLMFSFGPFIAGRYLLPVLPVAVVLMAIGFATMVKGPDVLGRAAGWALAVVAFAQIALLGFGAAIEFQLASWWEAAVFSFLSVALVVWIIRNIRNPRHAPFVLPAAAVVTFALLFVPVARLVMPSVAVAVAAQLRELATPPLLDIHQDAEMYVRLLSGKASPFRDLEPDNIGNACMVVTDDSNVAEGLRIRGFSVQTVQGGYGPELEGLFEAVIRGRLAEARRENADTVYIATCGTSGSAAWLLSLHGTCGDPSPDRNETQNSG